MPDGWQPAPATVSLARGEVHIWRLWLDDSQRSPKQLETALVQEEKERAARFHFQRDRQRYVYARSALRALLGSLLSLHPRDVQLQVGVQGKPYLAAAHKSDIQFNVSHSYRVALIALARGLALGVDVEHARELEDMARIARRFFSAQEVAALEATPRAEQQQTFFRIWSRKEAFIKATGLGLSQTLGAFSVMAADGRPLTHVELDGETTGWQLWDLQVGADYGAALVFREEQASIALRLYRFS